jgi:hypothetical protein
MPSQSVLGVHAMQPDRRHTMCGVDLIPEGLRAFPDLLAREVTCPVCLDVLAAVG